VPYILKLLLTEYLHSCDSLYR